MSCHAFNPVLLYVVVRGVSMASHSWPELQKGYYERSLGWEEIQSIISFGRSLSILIAYEWKDWHPVEENNRRTHKRLDGIADPARVFSIFLSKIMAAISLILMAAEGWGEKEICTKGARGRRSEISREGEPLSRFLPPLSTLTPN